MILIHDKEYNIKCSHCGSINSTAFKKLQHGGGEKETDFHYWIECNKCKKNNDTGWMMPNMAEWDWALINKKVKMENRTNKHRAVPYEEINRKKHLENKILIKENEISKIKNMIGSIQ